MLAVFSLFRSLYGLLRELNTESLGRHELRLWARRQTVKPIWISKRLELLHQLLLAALLFRVFDDAFCHDEGVLVERVTHVWPGPHHLARATRYDPLAVAPVLWVLGWRAYNVHEALWTGLIGSHGVDGAGTRERSTAADWSSAVGVLLDLLVSAARGRISWPSIVVLLVERAVMSPNVSEIWVFSWFLHRWESCFVVFQWFFSGRVEVGSSEWTEIFWNGVLRKSRQICYESLLTIKIGPTVNHIAYIWIRSKLMTATLLPRLIDWPTMRPFSREIWGGCRHRRRGCVV